jgi:flagellar biosynthesis anti-sigma factor FlgM
MKIQHDPALSPAPTGATGAAKRTEVGAHGAPEDAVQAAAKPTGRPAATVDLSTRSRELHEAMRLARAAHEVRNELVEQIKTQVENGTYSVDPAEIASGMLDRRA